MLLVPRRPPRLPLVVLPLLVVLTALSAGLLSPACARSPTTEVSVARVAVLAATGWEPPGHTVVRVRGNRDDGFTLRRYDGSVDYPPTRSEALAECSGYDTRRARVRCRAEVRTSYADLGELKRSLRAVRSVA